MSVSDKPEAAFGEGRNADILAGVDNAVAAARRYLLSLQREDGHWCGELEGDTILESEYVLTMHLLGRLEDPKVAKAAEYLRRKQLAEGGWAIYPGGPAEVSASVKAYFVLKLVGDDPDGEPMARARAAIRSLGGIEACNSFTKIYLAIFGQYAWSDCPAVPPEIVLLPDGFVFNIYRMSSWSRAIVVPLSVIWAVKPACAVPEDASIGELRVPAAHVRGRRRTLRERAWAAFFHLVDRSLKLLEEWDIRPLRIRALAKAESWIHAHLIGSDGLGAIFPPIINTILAFRCLGYALDDERLTGQIRELEKLVIEEDETVRLQPCFSPVWDTALALHGLREAGVESDDPAILRAASWLLEKEVRTVGDWKLNAPEAEPGGWFFEYANPLYPDVDDTAEVLTALSKVRYSDAFGENRRMEAITRGVRWVLAMQNSDGGWGAFDRDCTDEALTLIPFADHNAMIDPSCEDITGRTLETLHHLGFAPDHPAVARAAGFLRGAVHADGTWYGRWGCNSIYGTWLAISGLRYAGEPVASPACLRSAEWLYRHQNEDGGWGELPRSYDDEGAKGIGPSTPSQTAWALLTLFAAGDRDSVHVQRGVDYLLQRQRYDGSWKDEYWTGTGFPKVFYLRYHLYATYFPIWALAAYRRGAESAGGAGAAGAVNAAGFAAEG